MLMITHFKRGLEKWLQMSTIQHRTIAAAVNRCWKCSSIEVSNMFFCASCGTIRETSKDQDFFELLKINKEFKIDAPTLVQNYRHIQSMIHPDKFAQKSEQEKAIALEWSSLINKAYRTLSKSIERGKYLLALSGVTISEANTSVDKEFLFHMMDMNESVEDAQSTEQLQRLAAQLSEDVADLNSKLVQRFESNDMDGAKETIIRLKYLLNVEATIKEKLLQLDLKSALVKNAANSGYNFVMILTDDQDIMLHGVTPMVKTLGHIANEGITFTNAFTTSPICCPSRSSILTGKYAHNHKTTNNSLTGGCYGPYWQKTIEPVALPALLSNAGYDTFFAGKYLNEYFSEAIPPGWSQWFGLHGNSRYHNFTITENGKQAFYSDEYFTDYLNSKAIDYLQNVSEKHWLLTMEPATLPLELLNEIDSIHRKRWQTLMAVDDMVHNIVTTLKEKKLLENTFIFYTSDNGFHLGQFSQAYDKRQPYETDIRVPLFVRGPAITPKTVQDSAVALIDIVPTILQLANVEFPSGVDGRPLPLNGDRNDVHERQILIEYWGEGTLETHNPQCPWSARDRLQLCTVDAACHCQDAWNNTFNCVRHLAQDLNFIYCEFKDDQHFVEAYDIAKDLYQMDNIAYEILPSIRAKYSLALQNLTACVGPTCNLIY
uniref:J domain-containing protein n=1 Tax=Anopheles minimus TaxID=112268 RepID=A0A182WAT6_9DIPT